MRLPVIILNYNTSHDCCKCVEFLQHQEGVEIEIVIVDNCSRPEDVAELRKLSASEGCTLIENHENRGYNAGNNIGLRYAASKGYKYALIANPDMEFPQTDYVARLVEAMNQDPDIVVVGSDIVDTDGLHQNPLDFVSFGSELLWPIEMLRNKSTRALEHTQNRYCNVLMGCCLMVRMSFMKAIGLFDEGVFLYCEEAIFAHQVKQYEKKIYYTADTFAVHRHIKSEKSNPYKRLITLCNSRDYKNSHHSDYNGIQTALLYYSNCIRRWFLKLKLCSFHDK
jgi:GT2 family glycosyltransferase